MFLKMSVPKLFRVTLDTNPEDCNLSCVMCEEHSPYSHFKQDLFAETGMWRRLMPKEMIERIFEQASELGVQEVIPSTMGEPLLYEHIDLIYKLAAYHDIKINLTTNGTFPRRSVKDWAALIIPHTSDVKISWNGATAETYGQVMRGANFEKALDKLKAFIALRDEHYEKTQYYCRITLQLTFMAHTMHEIPAIVKLGAALGVDRIKGHHLWVHFNEIKEYAILPNPEYCKQWNKYVSDCHYIAKQFLKPDGTQVVLENIYPLNENKVHDLEDTQCPFLGRELWISATGVISPCCAPDNLRRSLGHFGSIHQTSLKDVLVGHPYIELQQNYRQKPLCKTCNMRRPL
jgi:glycosyltransferase, family 1